MWVSIRTVEAVRVMPQAPDPSPNSSAARLTFILESSSCRRLPKAISPCKTS